jgi:hypothetical protein
MNCARDWGLDGEGKEDNGGGLEDNISPLPMALWVLPAFGIGDGHLGVPGSALSLFFSSSRRLSFSFFLSESLPVLSPSLPLYVAAFAEAVIERSVSFRHIRSSWIHMSKIWNDSSGDSESCAVAIT